MAKVKNVATFPVDLTGGLSLGPGESSPGDVDLHDTHNALLVADGLILALQAPSDSEVEDPDPPQDEIVPLDPPADPATSPIPGSTGTAPSDPVDPPAADDAEDNPSAPKKKGK